MTGWCFVIVLLRSTLHDQIEYRTESAGRSISNIYFEILQKNMHSLQWFTGEGQSFTMQNHTIISAFNFSIFVLEYKHNATSSYYSCFRTHYFWSRDLIIAHHFNILLLCLSLWGGGGMCYCLWLDIRGFILILFILVIDSAAIHIFFTIWRNQQFVWTGYVMKRTGSMVKK